MAKTIKVKMNTTELGNVQALINFWEKDPALYGLLEILEPPQEDLAADPEIVLLKVSGGITYELWKKFCKESGMQILFPGY